MSSLKNLLSYECIPQSKITYFWNAAPIPYFGVQIAQMLQKAKQTKKVLKFQLCKKLLICRFVSTWVCWRAVFHVLWLGLGGRGMLQLYLSWLYLGSQWHGFCPCPFYPGIYRQYFTPSRDVFSDRIHWLCIALCTLIHLYVSLIR